ncbi:MAG: helix-turn-helix domain-containing protein [Candidatus Moranbacteria bacterium]|nr:helix-turn-helix domain-containing protein [Candidatus Moranbacteria bacterium]
MKKQKAIKLRKQGNSYKQISDKLDVAKSTLSYWLGNIEISKEAQEKISKRASKISAEALLKRNKKQTALAAGRAEKIRDDSRKEFSKLKGNKLFLVGVSLYWAEGYKKGAEGSKWKSVDFANSDPEMVMIMMRFFREICEVGNERIKIQLMTHPNVEMEEALRYWSEITEIPKNQFMRTCCAISKASNGKRPNRLTYGTVHIRINDVKLFFRIIGWIDGLKEMMKI